MKPQIILFAVLFTSVLSFTACITETSDPVDKNVLLGKWTIEEAFRNGRSSEMLRGAFFDIKDDGTMTSNFNMTGEEKGYTYKLEEGELVREDGMTLKMDAGDEHITFKTTLNGVLFKLVMRQGEPEE